MGELTDILRRNRGQAASADSMTPAATDMSSEHYFHLGGGVDEAPAVEIPSKRRGAWRSRAVLVDERGATAEQFRQLAVRILRHFEANELRTLAVASSTRAEGKTTSSCNLALALASVAGGRRVALVELDLRLPKVASGLDVKPIVGIEDVLLGSSALRFARLRTQLPSLDLFLARKAQLRAHELISSPNCLRMVAALAASYDLVVFDTPPVLLVPDAAILIEALDACLPVVRQGVTRCAALASLLSTIPDEKILGALLNEATTAVRARDYAYYTDK